MEKMMRETHPALPVDLVNLYHDILKEMEAELGSKELTAGGLAVHLLEQWIERKDFAMVVRANAFKTDEKPIKITSLTSRECEVMRLVATGNQNKQIAKKLGITERTIKVQSITRSSSLESRPFNKELKEKNPRVIAIPDGTNLGLGRGSLVAFCRNLKAARWY
jgi:hypothetical protein